MRNLRVGVIGVGYLGSFHAGKYVNITGVELAGVADTDQAKASAVAGRLGTTAYTDFGRLFGKVDAVSIAVPTVHHYAVARQCLEHGVHVLIEKPMTETIGQADELIGIAAGKGIVLQVGHIERLNPAVTSVKSRVKAPRYITAERAAPFTVRCTDVNVVLDLMIHDIDIAADLAGSDPAEVSAAGASVVTKEIDMASARIIFRNGCVADIAASRISDEKKRLIRVFDGENVYISDCLSQKSTVSRRDHAAPALVQEDISTERRDTLDDEIRAFIGSVMNGTRPLVSGSEGRRALALAKRITENIEKGIAGFVPAL